MHQQFTATGTYTDGSTANLTSQVTWASARPSVATISSTGLAHSLATGTTNITAALGSVTSPTDTLTVTAAALTSIAVTPVNPSVAKGLTQQFTATGTYTDGSTANLTSQVTWASARPSVATISSTGLATGVAQGTSVITATLGTVASPGDTLTVTVPLVAAYQLLNDRVTQNQTNFYVYQDADSGLNHGYPSGEFVGNGDYSLITVNPAAIDDPTSTTTGTTTDPNALDQTHGTVLQVTFGALSGSNYAGLNIEEPQDYGELPTGVGYDLTGATQVVFDMPHAHTRRDHRYLRRGGIDHPIRPFAPERNLQHNDHLADLPGSHTQRTHERPYSVHSRDQCHRGTERRHGPLG